MERKEIHGNTHKFSSKSIYIFNIRQKIPFVKMSQSYQEHCNNSQQLNIHHSCFHHLKKMNFRIKSIIRYGKKKL